MRYLLYCILSVLVLGSCTTVNDDRIPTAPVNVTFSTTAMWEVYGVTGALQYRNFIKDKSVPTGYPYTALTYTGFGGVLLCGDIHGTAVAYDLACPVERERSVLIIVDEEAVNAYCPVCHSVYDVFANNGIPLAGKAAQLGYGLRRYHVHPSTGNAAYVISN